MIVPHRIVMLYGGIGNLYMQPMHMSVGVKLVERGA